jgi:hypothetical protein
MTDYAPYPSDKEAIEEYKTLRAEILESQRQRVTLLQVSLGGVVVLCTYFLRDDRVASHEALLLATLTTAAGLFTYSTRVRERRIANFIATFMSPMSPWSGVSIKEARLTFFQRSSTTMILALLIVNAAFVIRSFPGWPVPESTPDVFWIAALGLSLAQFLVLWKTTRLPDFKPAFERLRGQMTAPVASDGVSLSRSASDLPAVPGSESQRCR